MSYLSSTTIPNSKSTLPRPSIVEVVEQSGVHLRRAGREFTGLCPFHSEKTPSFYVNADKGLFYCHGCGAKGNVFGFVMQSEGVDFRGALAHLGLSARPAPTKGEQAQRKKRKREAHLIKQWAMATSEQIGAMLRLTSREIHMAKEFDLAGELERLERVWMILTDLDDDLFISGRDTVDLYNSREDVARLLEVVR